MTVVVAVFAAVPAVQALGGGVKAPATAKTTIKVTVGGPSELSVKLSEVSKIPAGSVVFDVTNSGKVKHTFKLCSKAATTLANTCAGKAVTVATHGQSATLKMTLAKGKYEFLVTTSGQTALGKKGLIGVALAVPATTQTIPKGTTTTTTPPKTTPPKTTTPPTTTTPPKTTIPKITFPTGNAANGASVYNSAGCGSCHILKAAGSLGDVGPNLDLLMPTISDVEIQVYSGGGDMPEFGDSLTTQQIADVATYVSTNA